MQAVGLQPALLRVDSALPEQPGSAKMVSLDLLLGSSTPATPRDPDLQLPVRTPAAASPAAWARLPLAQCS